MRDLNKIIINEDITIKGAMKAIDNGSIKMVLVVDNSMSLKGVVTDGDIRRGILNGMMIDESIDKVINKSPVYVFEGEGKDKIKEILKTKEIIGLPIVDRNMIIRDFALLDNDDIKYFNYHPIPKKHLNKILVIGGGGYIGSVLVKRLLNKGYKVRILDKFIYGDESILEFKANSNVEIFNGDTRNIDDIVHAISDVDAVVHLAELVGDPACALNPTATQSVNYFATRMVASVCKHYQINRLVYMSSCSVYGASNGEELLTEKSSLNPVSLYAKMKIACEIALNEMKDDNFKPTILRLGTVFGFSNRPRFDLVVNILTAKAIRERKITIFGGDQWRPNVHVNDVSDTIISVLESPLEVVGGEVFNVGTEENNLTINRIGELVKQEIPEAELIIEEKDVDKRNYKVNFEKLKSKVGVTMKMSVLDGIKEIKNELEKNQNLNHNDPKHNNIKYLQSTNSV